LGSVPPAPKGHNTQSRPIGPSRYPGSFCSSLLQHPSGCLSLCKQIRWGVEGWTQHAYLGQHHLALICMWKCKPWTCAGCQETDMIGFVCSDAVHTAGCIQHEWLQTMSCRCVRTLLINMSRRVMLRSRVAAGSRHPTPSPSL